MGQGVHDRPGDIGVTGRVRTRCAVGHLTATGGASLDGQECLGDVVPAGIPFDATALNRVLGFEHQRVFGFQAVVDRGRSRIEVAHQVENPIANTRGIDTDVLHVKTLGEFLDLVGLVLERLPAPTVLFQDSEFSARLQRRRDNDTARVITRSAGVVSDPYRTVTVGAWKVRIIISPQRQVGITALKIGKSERAHGAVNEFAAEQLLKLVLVVLQAQLLDVEQITTAGNGIVDCDDLSPLSVRTKRSDGDVFVARPRILGHLSLAVAEFLPGPERVRLVRHSAGS